MALDGDTGPQRKLLWKEQVLFTDHDRCCRVSFDFLKPISSPNGHCVDTALEYQCSELSWANMSSSLGQMVASVP